MTGAMRSNVAAKVSVRHAAASEASCRASGARSERQRAEARGIAAEIGAKRRLQRKARSRSDAPRFIVCIRESVSIFGTVITITVCTIAFTGIGTVPISIGIRGTGAIIMRGTRSRVTFEWCDARLMSGRA